MMIGIARSARKLIATVDRLESERPVALTYINLFGWALACVAVKRPSGLATAVTTGAIGYLVMLLALWVWRRAQRTKTESSHPRS